MRMIKEATCMQKGYAYDQRGHIYAERVWIWTKNSSKATVCFLMFSDITPIVLLTQNYFDTEADKSSNISRYSTKKGWTVLLYIQYF
jgi:hypothetical protein